MAEKLNNNVFDATKKFVDFAGLDYFWEKAKAYVDGVDAATISRVKANEDSIKAINADILSITGGNGSINAQITNTITNLNLPNTYDTKGAAEKALSDAKDYADGLDVAMGMRVSALELIDHQGIVDDAINEFATKLSDDNTVNSYKELIDYAAEHGAEFTSLVGTVNEKADITYVDGLDQLMDARVDALESSKNDYIAADTTLETTLKGYVDGKVDNKFDSKGTAQSLVNTLTNGAVKSNTDAIAVINGTAEGSIAKAKADAIADAAAKLKAVTDSLKSAAFVEVATLESTMDSKDATNLAAAKTYAATYTDNLFDSFKFASNSDIDSIFSTAN